MNESWWKVAAKVGVPSLIALWLVYQLGGDMKQDMRDTRLNSEATLAAVKRHENSMSPIAEGMRMLVNLQLQQCVNDADDYVKRNRCFAALYKPPER